jgi:hypothetical protein
MRAKNKELVKKLRELDSQLEKQDEANQLRERCAAPFIAHTFTAFQRLCAKCPPLTSRPAAAS